MDAFEITYPEEDDWPWIIEQHAETALASLPADLQRPVTLHIVKESLAVQSQTYRASHGETNQVFLVHNSTGLRAGYIWVAQVRHGFTGELQAHVLNLFVVAQFRGQGIGAHLMAQAEKWAMERHFTRIGLSVSAHNAAAISLYSNLGYTNEMLRMTKMLETG